MAWLAIPVVLGLGTLFLGSGCNSNAARDAAAGEGGPSPNASGSAYAPANPPTAGSGLAPVAPPRIPAAVPVAPAPANIASDSAAVRRYAGEALIDAVYLPRYNNDFMNMTGVRSTAIEYAIRDIQSEMNRGPIRASVSVNGATQVITIDDPISVFVTRLVEASPTSARDEVRREAEAAIRRLRGGAGGADSPPARPADPNPRPAGSSPRPARPRPPTATGPDFVF